MDTLNPPDYRHDTVLPLPMEVTANAWAVDAACSGNPGPMEYQAIDLATGAQVFHFGPMHGTNNIGEFLAIVHALALLDRQGITGKTILLRNRINPACLGGVRLDYDGQRLDGTVKNRLDRLGELLNNTVL